MSRKSFLFYPENSARLARMRATTRGRSATSVVDLALKVLEDNVNAKKAGNIKHTAHDGSTKDYDPLIRATC